MLEVVLIIGGVLLRLLPRLPNFTPLSASALFGGTYLKKRFALIIPIAVIAISDYFLLYMDPFSPNGMNFSSVQPLTAMFHSTTLYVWGSFLISGLIGLWLRKRKTVSNVVLGSLLCTLQFFLITNFGVWAAGAYSRGLDGLITSYFMGLPFLRWTLLGDLFYTMTFFGAYEVAKRLNEGQQKTHAVRMGFEST